MSDLSPDEVFNNGWSIERDVLVAEKVRRNFAIPACAPKRSRQRVRRRQESGRITGRPTIPACAARLDTLEQRGIGWIARVQQHGNARQFGRKGLQQPSCFALMFTSMSDSPVILPPGRARLATIPAPTRSSAAATTVTTVLGRPLQHARTPTLAASVANVCEISITFSQSLETPASHLPSR
jgi:hypothetical protein